VPARSGRASPAPSIAVSGLGAAAITISPITPWTMVLALWGMALLVPGAVILIVWLLRHW
jgi:hypothetical protein